MEEEKTCKFAKDEGIEMALIRNIFVCALLFFFPLMTSAQHGQLAAMCGVVKDSYNFWLYAPREYVDEGARVPVIIFLHGASLCGNDLSKVRRYGLLDAIKRGRYYPCFVIAPQNSGGSWNPTKILKILDRVEAHYDVDK